MTRPETRRRIDLSSAQRSLGSQTAAASALAGGAIAVMALWKSAAANGATSGGGR